jgi:hemerythrin-like domain-containing protein
MTSLEVLTKEHELVHSLIATLETVIVRLERGEAVPPAVPGEILGALSRWAEQIHMAKEERVMFPYLHDHGLPRSTAVVEALVHQHEAIKVYGRRMREACARLEDRPGSSPEPLVTAVHEFLVLFREHMRIEEQYFYELADAVIAPADRRLLQARFDEIDRVEDAAGAYAAARRVLDRAAVALGSRPVSQSSGPAA